MTTSKITSMRLTNEDKAQLEAIIAATACQSYPDAVKYALDYASAAVSDGELDWISVKRLLQKPSSPVEGSSTTSFVITEGYSVVCESIKSSLDLERPRISFVVRLALTLTAAKLNGEGKLLTSSESAADETLTDRDKLLIVHRVSSLALENDESSQHVLKNILAILQKGGIV
ncbi:MAG: hypothetical protein Q3989_08400 [Eubacteriales bacterium]|nr:hypothetical protein [Eubacteriales bacterium]